MDLFGMVPLPETTEELGMLVGIALIVIGVSTLAYYLAI
jgi:hypothetical protein